MLSEVIAVSVKLVGVQDVLGLLTRFQTAPAGSARSLFVA